MLHIRQEPPDRVKGGGVGWFATIQRLTTSLAVPPESHESDPSPVSSCPYRQSRAPGNQLQTSASSSTTGIHWSRRNRQELILDTTGQTCGSCLSMCRLSPPQRIQLIANGEETRQASVWMGVRSRCRGAPGYRELPYRWLEFESSESGANAGYG